MSPNNQTRDAKDQQPLKAQEAGWSDYWRKEGVGGEVFVGPQNQRNEKLGLFWQQEFSGVRAESRVLDIACGAGSIFAALPENHGYELHGSDVSDAALKLMKSRIKGVRVSRAPATALEYSDGRFDLVVSQFGLEYAGVEAFTEAARVVGSGGAFSFLCHCEGGYVDQRTASQLAGAQAARSSQFALKAAQLVRAMFALEPNAVKQRAADFQKSEAQLRKAIEQNPEGIHAHLYQGFRQIYGDYKNYALPDILKWLADVSAEVEMAVARLTQMQNAMLSEARMYEALERMSAAGLTTSEPRALKMDDHDLPLAWHLSGTRADASS